VSRAANRAPSTRIRSLVPLIVVLGYLTFTVVLFETGPWPWPVTDTTKLMLFLLSCHGVFMLGYLGGSGLALPGMRSGEGFESRLLWGCIMVGAVLVVPTCFARTGHLVPPLIAALRNPGTAYSAALAHQAAPGAGVIVEYIRVLVSPLLFAVFPLTVYHWDTISSLEKAAGLAVTVGYVLIGLSTGQNATVAEIVLLLPWVVAAGVWSGHIRLNGFRKWATVVLVVVMLLSFLVSFSRGQETRYGSYGATGWFMWTGTRADADNWFVHAFPRPLQAGVLGLSSYLTQGYYALSLALDKPFVPMFGVGSSMFLYRNAAEFLGNPRIAELPYPERLQQENGWDARVVWSTVYAWLASDLSFPGVILLMGVVGLLLAVSWRDALSAGGPFALLFFTQLMVFCYYIPAGNRVGQGPEQLVTFWVTLTGWGLTRRRVRWGSRGD
jgi:hypothetical protein